MSEQKILANLYTKQQAQDLLHMEPYQIDNLVAAQIVKKVKIPGIRPYYTKESVDSVWSRLFGNGNQTIFRRVETEDDRKLSVDLSVLQYGESARNRDPAFSEASEEYLLVARNKALALFTCTALTPQGIERFCYDYGWSLVDYFVPLSAGPALECILWFLVTPDVDNKKQLEYYRDFRRALRSIWRDWGERGIHIKCVYVNGMHATHRIHVLLKRMGFKHFSTQGKRMIFCLETSTQTPILLSYQEALAAYKRTHK